MKSRPISVRQASARAQCRYEVLWISIAILFTGRAVNRKSEAYHVNLSTLTYLTEEPDRRRREEEKKLRNRKGIRRADTMPHRNINKEREKRKRAGEEKNEFITNHAIIHFNFPMRQKGRRQSKSRRERCRSNEGAFVASRIAQKLF